MRRAAPLCRRGAGRGARRFRRAAPRDDAAGRRRFPDLDVVFIEPGGDNLAATFSPELADLTIYVIDVAAGEKIPRKGGPDITRSDLLVINKTDLAPHVGANLDVMDADTRRMRGDRPFVFTDHVRRKGLHDIVRFIEERGAIEPSASATGTHDPADEHSRLPASGG